MYGFGMSKHGSDKVCNIDKMYPDQSIGLHGYEELMESYKNYTIEPDLVLSGPSRFSPLLKNFMDKMDRMQSWN